MVQEQVDVEYIFFCRCIKNTSTDGTVLKEHQLNASRSNADNCVSRTMLWRISTVSH